MKTMVTKRFTPIAGALVVLGTSAGVLSANERTRSDDRVDRLPSAEQLAEASPVPPVQAIASEQQAAFTILRRAQNERDRFNSNERAVLGGRGFSGKNIGLARAIATPNGKGYVVPGQAQICLAVPTASDEGFALACNSTRSAAAGQLIATMSRPNHPEVKLSGLLPDGATTPVVSFRDGTTRELPVDAQGVLNDTLHDPSTVSFDTPSGRHTENIAPVREDKITVQCGDGSEVSVKQESELPTACG